MKFGMLSSSWFKQRCHRVMQSNKTVWIAYSGGVDSHVLLHLARNTISNLRAVHIHHGLSPNADQWLLHCQSVCENLAVPLTCIRVNANPKPKQSPEDAARIARRKAWAELLSKDDVLFLAQHADDQTETILYRLVRGTGPHGLGGMAELSTVGQTTLFRPLLTTSKQQILDYAEQNKLLWISDESNTDIRYDRNYIRQQIMPLLKERWSRASENINRAGKLSAQLCSTLEPLLQAKLNLALDANNKQLKLDVLESFDSVWQVTILRAWLQLNKVECSHKHLELMLQQVIDARADATPEFVLGNKIIRRNKQQLYCLERTLATIIPAVNFQQCWDLATEVILPNGRVLTQQNLDIPPTLAEKLQQQSVVVRMGEHGKKAKKIFQQFGIPPWQRNEFPLLFVEQRLIGIVGLWWSSRWSTGE